MQPKKCAMFSAVCGSLILVACVLAEADEPSLSDLIELAPAISSSDKSYSSIDIEGSINSYMKFAGGRSAHRMSIRFRAIYRSPGQYALFVNDGFDETPLLFAADEKAFVYDPVRPVVVYMTEVSTQCVVRQAQNELQFSLGCDHQGRKSSELTCDIKSLVSTPDLDCDVAKTAGGTHRLTLTSGGPHKFVAAIDTSRPIPYTRIDLRNRGNDATLFSVNKIVINSTLADGDFAFPSKEQLSAEVDVIDMSDDSLLSASQGFALLLRALHVRAAINAPELREAIDGIDWEHVKANDKRFSQALRAMLPAEPKVR